MASIDADKHAEHAVQPEQPDEPDEQGEQGASAPTGVTASYDALDGGASTDATAATADDAQASGERVREHAAELRGRKPKVSSCLVCLADLATEGRTSVLLPCCHSICQECYGTLVTSPLSATSAVASASPAPSCPFCGVLGAELTSGYRPHPNLFVRLPSLAAVASSTSTKLHCHDCADKQLHVQATNLCQDCGERPLCQGHSYLHSVEPGTAAHMLVPAPAAPATTAPSGPPAQTLAPLTLCSLHGAPLKTYCKTCRQCGCMTCLLATHPTGSHEVVLLAEHAPQLQADLQRALRAGLDRQTELASGAIRLTSAKSDLDMFRQAQRARINQAFETMHGLLRVRQEAHIASLDKHIAEQAAELSEAVAGLDRRWLTLEAALDAAQSILTFAAPADATTALLGRLGSLVTSALDAASREVVGLPETRGNVNFEVEDDVEARIAAIGRFRYWHAHGPNCTAAGDGLVVAFIHSPAQFTVTTRSRSGDAVTTGGATVQVRFSVNPIQHRPADVSCTVRDCGDGTYVVTYYPQQVAVTYINVTVNGDALPSGPFAVTVRAHSIFKFVGASSGSAAAADAKGSQAGSAAGSEVYDNRGIIYHLGTRGHTQPWANPHEIGVVRVSASSVGGGELGDVVGNRVGDFYTQGESGAWVAVDLRANTVRPTGYVLSFHRSGDGNYPRAWVLEGRNGQGWTVLKAHVNDTSLSAANKTAYWPLVDEGSGGERHDERHAAADHAAPAKSYNAFRIRQTGPASHGADALVCSGWEVYGELLANA